MSDTLIGVIIGGIFGFVGALLGNFLTIWVEGRKERRESLHAIRLRLVGDRVQTSEIMRFIESERQRKWPLFWKKGIADLSQVTLEGAVFRDRDLQNVRLYRANLRGVSFYRVNLQTCKLTSADLSEANFHEVNARGNNWFRANCAAAQLYKTDLSGSEMYEVNFSQAQLNKSRFYRSDLRSAKLEGAKLKGSDLRQANLAGANMSGATLEDTNVEGAVFDLETIWPKDFDPEQAGAKLLKQSGSSTAMAEAGIAWIWGEEAATAASGG